MQPLETIDRAPDPAGFDAACTRLNQWRGQMIENFARCEQAVTETLAGLDRLDLPVKGSRYPHLFGQRFDRLQALLLAVDPQTGHIKVASMPRARFREQDPLRAMLCHGVAKAAIDRSGDWVAVMTLTSFKFGAMTSDKLALTEGEGAALLAKLIDARRKSCAALGQVRREVAKHS